MNKPIDFSNIDFSNPYTITYTTGQGEHMGFSAGLWGLAESDFEKSVRWGLDYSKSLPAVEISHNIFIVTGGY